VVDLLVDEKTPAFPRLNLQPPPSRDLSPEGDFCSVRPLICPLREILAYRNMQLLSFHCAGGPLRLLLFFSIDFDLFPPLGPRCPIEFHTSEKKRSFELLIPAPLRAGRLLDRSLRLLLTSPNSPPPKTGS